jgi:nicotinamidase-related amidase
MADKPKICLLVIDPQNDFCEKDGRLSVPGANEDMARLGTMVRKFGGDIDDIQITMDSHYLIHIAHSRCWVDKKGRHPDPFFLHSGNKVPTPISLDMVKNGEYRAYNAKWQQRYVDYVTALKANDRYKLMIWPDHCIIGHSGQLIFNPFFEAVNDWEDRFFATAQRHTKGSNPFTEHYSAVRADVEDPEDPKTRLNTKLIDLLKTYDMIIPGGEALSHCLAFTLRDVFKEFGVDQIQKFTLMLDACSSVPGCEQMGEDFIKEFTAAPYYMKTAKTTDFF